MEYQNEYYVYLHIDPQTNEVFYVGKGAKSRAEQDHSRNEKWAKKVKELCGNYKIAIVKKGLSEKEALTLESELIKKYDITNTGKRVLTNKDQLRYDFYNLPDEDLKKTITINIGSSEKSSGDLPDKG